MKKTAIVSFILLVLAQAALFAQSYDPFEPIDVIVTATPTKAVAGSPVRFDLEAVDVDMENDPGPISDDLQFIGWPGPPPVKGSNGVYRSSYTTTFTDVGFHEISVVAYDDRIPYGADDPEDGHDTYAFWITAGTSVSELVVTDDGTHTSSTTQLHARWCVTDSQKKIVDYQYAVGTSPSDPKTGYTVGWTSVGTATEAVTPANVTFSLGTKYFFYVKATTGTGSVLQGASDGIIIGSEGPYIGPITDNAASFAGSQIPQYEKYEAAFVVQVNGENTPGSKAFASDSYGYNPFSPKLTAYDTSSSYTWKRLKGIYVDALITKPSDPTHTVRWPCFYDYDRNGDGTHEWKFRFAPTETGTWSYQIEVRYAMPAGSGIYVVTSPVKSFTCTTNSNPITGRGFLRKDIPDPWFFSFSGSNFGSYGDDSVFYPYGVKCLDTLDIASLAGTENADGTYSGGNFSRVFSSSHMFEEKYSGTYAAGGDRVNDFRNLEHTPVWEDADYWDNLIESARTHGVYLISVLNNWTWWKDTSAGGSNPYILEGVASSASDAYSANNLVMREVYKRKLRWMLARWGYATSLIGFDLVNETASGQGVSFHNDMARFVNGDPAAIPTGANAWPVDANDAAEQPHLLSGDHTSCRYDTIDVNWPDDPIGMVNFHDYACSSEYWNGINVDKNGADYWEKMGSALDRPWFDMAVWADRMGMKQRELVRWNSGYKKPLSWTEFGFAGEGHNGDWNEAYSADTNAQHARDWFWALIFNKISGCHWKTEYFRGDYNSPHWDIFKPLAKFLKDADMRGMVQESYYYINELNDPDTHIYVTETNISVPARYVEVYGLRSIDKAYLYVKNMTSTWYGSAGFTDATLPLPAAQNVWVTVKGLSATAGGTEYVVEKWSTISDTVGPEIQRIRIQPGVNLSFQTTLDASGNYAWAYKIYKSGN